MRIKAYFITILILLAAHFGVAQENYVVYEGAETSHSVVENAGSIYFWEVYKNFNPNVPADPTEFYFVGPDDADSVSVHWILAGLYFLQVEETASDGCTNIKTVAISVIPNNRSIGFENESSASCANGTDNGFVLPLELLENDGDLLDASNFPVEVSFTVNGTEFNQSVSFDSQELVIGENMFSLVPAANTSVVVEITQATDKDGSGISPSESKLHTRIIFAPPEIEFSSPSVSVKQGDSFTHVVNLNVGEIIGATFVWSVTPEGGTSSDLSLIDGNEATILWDGEPGIYTLTVQVTDGNGCAGINAGDKATQTVEILPPVVSGDLIFSPDYADANVCSDLSGGEEGSDPAENSTTFEVSYSGDLNLLSVTITIQNPLGVYVGLDGIELTDQLNPEITIENLADSKEISFEVTNDWENIQDTSVSFEITLIKGERSDFSEVSAAADYNLRYIHVLSKPLIAFVNIPDTIALNTTYSFAASGKPSYAYSWWYVDEDSQRTDFTSVTNKTEEYLWDTEGTYMLFAQAKDTTDCLSEIISDSFVVSKNGGVAPQPGNIYAIPDFVVGVENIDVVGDVGTNDFIYPYDSTNIVHNLIGDTLPGLTFYEDGSFIYVPQSNETGKFIFTYEVCFEGNDQICSVAEVEIRILSSTPSENVKPIASTDVVLTQLDQPVSGNTLVNDANYITGTVGVLSISEIPIESPDNGTLELFSDGSFTYTPNTGFSGVDKFRYQLCNNQAPYLCDSAWVYIYVDIFDVQTQDPPLSIYDDMVVYRKDSVYSVALNDFAMDDQLLIYTSTPIEGSHSGVVQIDVDGTFNYQPNPGFVGVDWFVYEVCGGEKGNNCRTATAFILVGENEFSWIVDAGKDTTIGSCDPYILQPYVSETVGMSYFWQPFDNLDDPTILNPVFTPGNSTTFTLTVTNSLGSINSDTVRINVSEIYADAGEDIVIEEGTGAMLDGSASFGEQIDYLWTTVNGTIESGADGPNPIISSAGTYYLQVTDSYNCVESDSVIVSRLTFAPIARDDYDTTSYQTPVYIAVLENDEDPDGDLDPSSLQILQYPVNGSVYINYDDYTVNYAPNNGFVGGDVFEYTICDSTDLCDNAHVYVLVLGVDFLIPEAFTPNGDNINDYFEIQGIEQYPGNTLSIVNRWGKAVYEARNYGIETDPKFWDGTWQKGDGKELPTGTYFYVLDLGNGQQPIAGSVYIDR